MGSQLYGLIGLDRLCRRLREEVGGVYELRLLGSRLGGSRCMDSVRRVHCRHVALSLSVLRQRILVLSDLAITRGRLIL
jgi:hypothetical protein